MNNFIISKFNMNINIKRMASILVSPRIMSGIFAISFVVAAHGASFSRLYTVEAQGLEGPSELFPIQTVNVEWSGHNMESDQTVSFSNIFEYYQFETGLTNTPEMGSVIFSGNYDHVNKLVTIKTPLKITTSWHSGTTGGSYQDTYIMSAPNPGPESRFTWEESQIVFKVDDEGRWILHSNDNNIQPGIGGGYVSEYIPFEMDEYHPYTLTAYQYPNIVKSMTFTPHLMAVEDIVDDQGNTESVFDLLGRPVRNPGKGIYIRNGKKVVL